MANVIIKMTEKQRDNLIAFLTRVTLSGAEAEEYMNIVTQIRKAEKEESKDEQ